jgi:ketosteroid isomerase-like protein
MTYDWNPPAEDVAALRAWLAAWDALVKSVDFVPARALFAPNIASFGTKADVVEGIASLEDNQWRAVWPAIEDFAFDIGGMKVGVSPDRLIAFLIATWTAAVSTGRAAPPWCLRGRGLTRRGSASTPTSRSIPARRRRRTAGDRRSPDRAHRAPRRKAQRGLSGVPSVCFGDGHCRVC